MLRRRRDDMKVGELIPLGDLWDVLADGIGEAFTDRLRREAEAAQRFYTKARAWLVERHGGEHTQQFRATDRLVKTLILAALAPQVSALTRLTGSRLAALNHGSLRARTVSAGSLAVTLLPSCSAVRGASPWARCQGLATTSASAAAAAALASSQEPRNQGRARLRMRLSARLASSPS